MRKKFRKCVISGCHQQVFAKGKCRYHYQRSQKPLPKTSGIKSGIPKNISFEKGLSNNITIHSPFRTELEMFKWIWKSRKHKSFLTDRKLDFEEGENIWYNLFAHVLSKGQNMFPLFKLNENNIILLTPYEHSLLDHGTIQQRQDYSTEWLKISVRAKFLWNKYHELDPDCIPLPKKYQ